MKRRWTGKRRSSRRERKAGADVWAAATYGNAPLPDERLRLRAVKIAAALAAKPLDSIPQAHEDWGQSKATYRFIENRRVTADALKTSAADATARACRRERTILVPIDLTTLSFPNAKATEGLGPVGKEGSRGMLLQTALALTEDGVVIGPLDLQIWCRDPEAADSRSKAKTREIEEKESRRWLEGVRAVDEAIRRNLPADQRPRIIFVFDREGDIHEAFEECIRLGHSFVIRCQGDRRIEGDDEPVGHAHEAVRTAPLLAKRTLPVPRQEGRPARQARVEMRSVGVRLLPNTTRHSRPKPLNLSLVEVREPHPPDGVEPLHWMLWTVEPAETVENAVRVQGIYQSRWRIEDYHKVLKSGCQVEKLQLESAARLAKAITFYAPIAARILRLRDLARREPEAPCTLVLSELEWQTLWTAIHHRRPPAHGPPPTLRQAVLWIGRLGGHLNRKSDGMPGIKTLWLGWRDLLLMTDLYATLTR